MDSAKLINGDKLLHSNYMRVGRPGHLKQFFFDRIEPEKFHIADIAFGLAKACRYLGTLKGHYSVAEHCVLGSYQANTLQVQRQFMLHDANEFIFGDVPSPLKQFLTPEYKDLTHRYEVAIYEKYGCDPIEHPKVKIIDRRMLATEQLHLRGIVHDTADYEPYLQSEVKFECYERREAYTLFVLRFQQLFPEWSDECQEALSGVCNI